MTRTLTNPASVGSLASHLIECGVDVVVGVPDSGLSAVVLELSASLRVIGAPREDAAVATACGLTLGGRRPVVFMKNAGLFTAGDSLVSLAEDLGVSLLLLVGWAGSGGDSLPHHVVTGDRTEAFLDAVGVKPYRYGPATSLADIVRACKSVQAGDGHVAVLVSP